MLTEDELSWCGQQHAGYATCGSNYDSQLRLEICSAVHRPAERTLLNQHAALPCIATDERSICRQ